MLQNAINRHQMRIITWNNKFQLRNFATGIIASISPQDLEFKWEDENSRELLSRLASCHFSMRQNEGRVIQKTTEVYHVQIKRMSFYCHSLLTLRLMCITLRLDLLFGGSKICIVQVFDVGSSYFYESSSLTAALSTRG